MRAPRHMLIHRSSAVESLDGTVTLDGLVINCIDSASLTPSARDEIIQLCNLAYEEDLTVLFETFGPAVHVMGRSAGRLISHAMWVTRWLQIAEGAPLRTAYVEMVATHPAHQRRGYASQIMRALASEILDYDMAALCPNTDAMPLYQRLGWEIWHGPLFIRGEDAIIPTPDETVLILRLSGTPVLDLRAPLSAEWRVGELW
jgi:aminoglycoside 2'-N-acetyltransferase I